MSGESAVVDYYKVLGVRQTASAAEIKSAYRRLARKRHPDVNGGSDTAAREFAMIALAYRTLSDPQERAYYDDQRRRIHNETNTPISVFHSDNPHAQRMRRMVLAQARFDRVVDRIIEAERRENFVLQQAVFTTVTLFLSTFFVALFKPRLWDSFSSVGRGVLLTLFLIGLWHLFSRLRAGFEHYTYRPDSIHDSIISEKEKPDKPFTRFTASAFLVVGYAASVAAGLFLGSQSHDIIIFSALPYFGQQVRPDLFFYPPIAVLIVDTMHTVASKID